jgi:hypothetical protein
VGHKLEFSLIHQMNHMCHLIPEKMDSRLQKVHKTFRNINIVWYETPRGDFIFLVVYKVGALYIGEATAILPQPLKGQPLSLWWTQ